MCKIVEDYAKEMALENVKNLFEKFKTGNVTHFPTVQYCTGNKFFVDLKVHSDALLSEYFIICAYYITRSRDCQ